MSWSSSIEASESDTDFEALPPLGGDGTADGVHAQADDGFSNSVSDGVHAKANTSTLELPTI